MTRLIHSQIPRAILPEISNFTVGEVMKPRSRGGPRALLPKVSNLQNYMPEYGMGITPSIYYRWASLGLRPDRPSPPSQELDLWQYDRHLRQFPRMKEHDNVTFQFKRNDMFPGVWTITVRVKVAFAMEAQMVHSRHCVITPTVGGLVMTRCNRGGMFQHGGVVGLRGPITSTRYASRPAPLTYKAEILEDGVIIVRAPPEKLLELYGVIVVH